MGEGLATTSRRLSARPTTNGLTHPPVQQDPTGDHPWRSAGPPGNLGMHHAVNQPGRASQPVNEAATVDPGLASRTVRTNVSGSNGFVT